VTLKRVPAVVKRNGQFWIRTGDLGRVKGEAGEPETAENAGVYGHRTGAGFAVTPDVTPMAANPWRDCHPLTPPDGPIAELMRIGEGQEPSDQETLLSVARGLQAQAAMTNPAAARRD